MLNRNDKTFIRLFYVLMYSIKALGHVMDI